MFQNFISSVKQNAKTYFKNKTVKFYIGFAMAVLSVFVAVYYAFAHPSGIAFNAGIFLLALFGGIAYSVILLFDEEGIAAFVLSVCDFFAMILFLRTNYTVFLENDFMSGEFAFTSNMVNLIVITVFLLVIAVTSNVLVWIGKKTKKAEEIENDAQA